MDFENYLSPFSWRYGSAEMRMIWSESNKRRTWRYLWATLAEVQAEYGLVTPEQVSDLLAHMEEINVERALEIEEQIQHDLMAELKTFAEQAQMGGGALHMGATSTDIEDNADVLRIRQALDLLLERLNSLLQLFAEKIECWAETPVMAFTHLQPAEPSTLGYRLAQYAQDLLGDKQALGDLRAHLRGKGFKGAVGTRASFAELLGGTGPAAAERLAEFEQKLSERLGLNFFPVTTQVYPRKQDYQVISGLAGLGASLYRFAFDLRILQSPAIGELSEPFGEKQVGSSAMPFKRNPINAEKIDSLGRSLAGMPRLAWDNAAHSLLERTLDDSANRRTLLPEAFLTADELLCTSQRLINGLQLDQAAVKRNLAAYSPFAAVERVLMALSKAGADRQVMHSRLRELSLTAWEAIQAGQTNPLPELICQDALLLQYLPAEQLSDLMDASQYLGDAPERARRLAAIISSTSE